LKDRAKITFAIAVFNEIDRLKTAVSRLRANGLTAGELLILARPDALDGRLLSEWNSLRGNSPVVWSQWISVGEGAEGRMIKIVSDTSHDTVQAGTGTGTGTGTDSGTGTDGGTPPGGDASRASSLSWNRIVKLAANFHKWLLPQQADGIHRRIRSGECALFIDVTSDEQLASICHLLLRFADHGVQTHQVSYAA